jgi:hypothetical protein
MSRLRNRLLAAAAVVLAALGGCEGGAGDAGGDAAGGGSAPLPRLGVMSSLPLVWPLGADVAAIAAGRAETPWQGRALGQDYVLEPLDTLAPIPGLSPGAPATDPLKGLARLAVIQPRGLSPQDNVALDDWVRGGGHLLLVLDPMLTGDYDLPLGDPRRPVDSALIPPVVGRWGMTVSFGDADSAEADTLPGGARVPLDAHGVVTLIAPGAQSCALHGTATATCRVGKGRVTLIADAAVFEHPELAGEGGATLRAAVREALE